MSTRLDAEGEEGTGARLALSNEFCDILVARWPGRTSMETILGRAGLRAGDYVVDTPRPQDLWHQAFIRITNHNKLLPLIAAVKRDLTEPSERQLYVLNELYALEEERHKKTELELQAGVVEDFSDLIERLRLAATHTVKLRKSKHLEMTDIATIESYLTGLYELLDKLQESQRKASGRHDEIVQAKDIEARTSKCTDALQLYMTLLQYANPADEPEQSASPGELGGRANDEIVLLRAKAGLRYALIRLEKAAGSIIGM